MAGRLYVHFGTHGTACLSLDGKVIWKTRELVYQPNHGSGGSPVLVDGLIVVSCDGSDVQFVAALDADYRQAALEERPSPLRRAEEVRLRHPPGDRGQRPQADRQPRGQLGRRV